VAIIAATPNLPRFVAVSLASKSRPMERIGEPTRGLERRARGSDPREARARTLQRARFGIARD
jgi:hypothetical protein